MALLKFVKIELQIDDIATLRGMWPTTTLFFIVAMAKLCQLPVTEVLHFPYLLILMVSAYHSIDCKFVMSHVLISHAKRIKSYAVHLVLSGSCLTTKILPSKCIFKLHLPKINSSKILCYTVKPKIANIVLHMVVSICKQWTVWRVNKSKCPVF